MKDKDWDMAHDAALAEGYEETGEVCGVEYVEYWVGTQRVTKLKAGADLELAMIKLGLTRNQRWALMTYVEAYARDLRIEYDFD